MQSLEVYKYITSLAHHRPHCLSADASAPAPIRSFAGADFTIHVLTSRPQCEQVLADATFIQPNIADAIEAVLQDHEPELQPLQLFIRNNPIQLDGERHRAARHRFVRDYKAAQQAIEHWLPQLAEQVFRYFIATGSSSVSQNLASRYVDDVIARILSAQYSAHIAADAWSGSASCIFEFFHAPKRLLDKGRQMAAMLQQLPKHSDVIPSDSMPILLTFLLQGRDPLIGALSGIMLKLADLTDAERRKLIATLNAREMFWQTSPVNYIGRTATRGVALAEIVVRQNDQLILMLPWAGHCVPAGAKDSLAFGGGAHVCAGQALAISIGDAFVTALRMLHDEIDWRSEKSETVVAGVFRQYRSGA